MSVYYIYIYIYIFIHIYCVRLCFVFVCFVVLCFVVCVLLFCVLLFIVDVHMWFLHARRATHRKHDVFRWCGNRCFIVLHMYLWILTLNFQETRACISKCTWLFNVFCCWNWTCICFFSYLMFPKLEIMCSIS